MPRQLTVSGISGQFEFELEGLCITRDTLAALLGPVRRDENTLVGVRLPEAWRVEDAQTRPDGTDLVQVDGFEIEVETVLSPPFILAIQHGADADVQAAHLHDRLAKIASDTARDFLTWVRLHFRQYWIAPDGRPVLRQSLIYATDAEDVIFRNESLPGRPVPFTMAAEVPGTAIALSGPAIAPSLDKVLSGEAAGLPERLLSSAFTKLWAGYPDAQTAVFLSALACETKVKEVLRVKAPAEQQQLLGLVIGDRRDITTSAQNLFDPLCKAVTGCSLREDGPNALWQALVLLIRARNDIAHRGAEPERQEAERHLETAMRVFDWLDALPAPRA